MTATALTTALIGLLAFAPGIAAQSDFNGTWVLDTRRSEGLPEGMDHTMTVQHSGDRIELAIQLKTPTEEQQLEDVYVLDGRETDFRPPIAGGLSSAGKRTSRWSEDRAGFEATEHVTIQGPEGELTVTAARKWTLAPDGDTLTLELTINGPQGEMKSKRVFARQKPSSG